jgi:hypothetical protein
VIRLRLQLVSVLMLFTIATTIAQSSKRSDPLILVADFAAGTYGYRTEAGKMIIPLGKYQMCFTDTFRNYAIVLDSARGFVAIDRQFHVLYNVFIFDNGPDYPAGGLFRITRSGKIGYAIAATGKIAIEPQFACAFPFEKGCAKVASDCQTRPDGEHSTWTSNSWFYINKSGSRVSK